MRNRILAALVAVSAVAASGCIGFERKSSPTSPTAAGNNSLMGEWTSGNIIPSPGSCTNFVWSVSEQTATSAKGNFSATCAGDLKVSGTAQGAFTAAGTIEWSGTATASAPGLTSCAVALSGTAMLTVDAIRIPYSGTTCLGPVSGTETLKRR
ncbi:MAG TPA: hypothetical protein VM364_08890 [Vicinamibacterales bacterium]|nr:hypothetical protein [Vicinamibacterales bacterium]